MKYLEFNNRNSNNLGLDIVNVKIDTPKPNIITEEVPYQNGVYDFSTLATGGIMTYGQRNITVDFNYMAKDKIELYKIYDNACTWLLGVLSELKFNYINGTYKGRCSKISELTTSKTYGTFSVIFTCNPFLELGDYGNYLWDPFNFDTDVAETNEFIVNTNDIITLFNDSICLNPTFTVSNDITIEIKGVQWNLITGDNKIFGLNLENGLNEIKVISVLDMNSSMQINFKKEII